MATSVRLPKPVEALAWHDLTPSDLPRSMTLGNSEAIRMAVQEGLGLGFVSTRVAAEALAAGTLAVVPIEGMSIIKTLYMIRNHQVPPTAAAAAFWDYAFAPENEALVSPPEIVAGEVVGGIGHPPGTGFSFFF